MSILIKGVELPKSGCQVFYVYSDGQVKVPMYANALIPIENVQAVHVPTPHGRLVDIDALNDVMYHEAFETDTPLQKWDSGCWIRYKMFEHARDNAPTVIEAEE